MRLNLKLVVVVLAAAFLSTCDGNANSTPAQTLIFQSADLVPRAERLTIGVGVHFGIGGEYNYIVDKSAALIRDLGADSYRDDLTWVDFDNPAQVPGQHEPRKLFDFMKLGAARPLLVLGYPNPAVEGGKAPVSSQARLVFADFSRRAVEATKGFDPIYEVWNEWNMNAKPSSGPSEWLSGPGDAGDPRAAMYYSALAKAAIPVMRQAAPNAALLAGAVGMDANWLWTQAIVAQGAVTGADGLSVHMYNQCEADLKKRTATDMADKLGALQADLSAKAGGRAMPVYLTESGWPTATATCVVSRQAAADNIAQLLFWSAATPWMKGVWIYQLKDQGRDQREMEQTFGLYDYDYNPKPAACAFKRATEIIKGAHALKLVRVGADGFLLQVDSAAGIRLIAWSTDNDNKMSLFPPANAPVKMQRLCGGPAVSSNGGIEVGGEPVIIDAAGVASLSVSVSPAQ